MKDITLKDQERVLMSLRQYGLSLFWHWALPLVFILLSFFFMFWLFSKGRWGQLLFAFVLLGSLLALFRFYVLWKKNLLVLTTHRVILLRQHNFLQREIVEYLYDQLDEVSGKIQGIFQSLFHYGSLTLSDRPDNPRLRLEGIKEPLRVQQVIHEFKERYLTKHAHEFSENVANLIIEKLYELESGELKRVRDMSEKLLKRKEAKIEETK